MKGYIVSSNGNYPEEDYICAADYSDHVRRVFLNKEKAERFCIDLQKYYDEDEPDNLYLFEVEEVEVIE